jgi:hypothetical protein
MQVEDICRLAVERDDADGCSKCHSICHYYAEGVVDPLYHEDNRPTIYQIYHRKADRFFYFKYRPVYNRTVLQLIKHFSNTNLAGDCILHILHYFFPSEIIKFQKELTGFCRMCITELFEKKKLVLVQ